MELLLGDCLEIMPGLPSHSIDAIICDPPFGTTSCTWDSIIPLESLWMQYKRLIKPDGVIVLFGGQPFTSVLISSNMPMFKYCWYWIKEKGTGFLNAKRQPLRAVEEICVFYNKRCTYNAQCVPLDKPYRHTLPIKQSDTTNQGIKSIDCGNPCERQYKTYTHAQPKNVLHFSRDKANRSLVPTQKPLALMEYLVKTYTNPGDTILDNCMGSGTTGLAAKNLGRKFIGIEKDKQHYQIAASRINTSI